MEKGNLIKSETTGDLPRLASFSDEDRKVSILAVLDRTLLMSHRELPSRERILLLVDTWDEIFNYHGIPASAIRDLYLEAVADTQFQVGPYDLIKQWYKGRGGNVVT